ncbi:hypothetical protein JTB14_022376 [Gonioctena quinquepunctata]|nr:hypothetical protein JTB14_022376 [Gonioctena quinquepunctata]
MFFDILCVGQIKTNASNPIIQKTKLGWVVSGHLNVENYDTRISCNIAISNDELYEQLQAFWKIEEVITKNHYTLEELECEEHYAKTFRRDDQGRFEVTLPVKDELNQLGESEKAAITRFSSIEKRFIRDSEYKRAHSKAPNNDFYNPDQDLQKSRVPPITLRDRTKWVGLRKIMKDNDITPIESHTVVDVHNPPSNELADDFLEIIIAESDTPTIAAGDFNAKHTTWSNVSNRNGSKLKRH